MDIPSLLARLTCAEKASLCMGSDFWHTRAVLRLGLPEIMVSALGITHATVDDLVGGLS